jgi:hypothetical protein
MATRYEPGVDLLTETHSLSRSKDRCSRSTSPPRPKPRRVVIHAPCQVVRWPSPPCRKRSSSDRDTDPAPLQRRTGSRGPSRDRPEGRARSDSSLGVHRSPLRRYDRRCVHSHVGRRPRFGPGLPRPELVPLLPFLPAPAVCSAGWIRRPTVDGSRVCCTPQPTMGFTTFPSPRRPRGRHRPEGRGPEGPLEASPVAYTLRSVPLLGSLRPCRHRVRSFRNRWRSPAGVPSRRSSASAGRVATLALRTRRPQGVVPPRSPFRPRSVSAAHRSMLPWALDRLVPRCCRAIRAAHLVRSKARGRFASRIQLRIGVLDHGDVEEGKVSRLRLAPATWGRPEGLRLVRTRLVPKDEHSRLAMSEGIARPRTTRARRADVAWTRARDPRRNRIARACRRPTRRCDDRRVAPIRPASWRSVSGQTVIVSIGSARTEVLPTTRRSKDRRRSVGGAAVTAHPISWWDPARAPKHSRRGGPWPVASVPSEDWTPSFRRRRSASGTPARRDPAGRWSRTCRCSRQRTFPKSRSSR